MDEKRCTKCRALKPRIEFYRQKVAKDGLHTWCKRCVCAGTIAAARKRRSTPNGRLRFRNTELKREYGITLADYERILAEQDGRCAICGTERPGSHGMHECMVVDHDHISGHVRGLLCSRCNSGVGYFWDDPSLMEAAAAYIRRSRRPFRVVS